MSDHAVDSTGLATLRARAASRLIGPAGSKGADHGAADALAVLHTLASSPATAADALALLHELQVHQVELDLQAQELAESRADLEAALRRQAALYELQPVACFTVDRRLVIRELNRAGATLLGTEPDVACGRGLDSFLPARTADLLHTLAAQAASGSAAGIGIEWRTHGGQARAMQAHLGPGPLADELLIVLAPTVR